MEKLIEILEDIQPDAVWKCWKGLWETQRLKKAQRNGKRNEC